MDEQRPGFQKALSLLNQAMLASGSDEQGAMLRYMIEMAINEAKECADHIRVDLTTRRIMQ